MSEEKEQQNKLSPMGKAQALFDILFKVGTPVALLLVAWMGSKFASKAEVDALRSDVNEIEKVLAVMVETNRINERQDQTIADHEERLRKLEQK